MSQNHAAAECSFLTLERLGDHLYLTAASPSGAPVAMIAPKPTKNGKSASRMVASKQRVIGGLFRYDSSRGH